MAKVVPPSQQLLAEVVRGTPPAELGEGSIWDRRCERLLWLDIQAAKLYRYDPQAGENEEHDLSMHSANVTSVVPVADDPTGNLVAVTLREGFATYNCSSKELKWLANNPQVAEGERFNDGKVDPAGRYWAGTLARDGAGVFVKTGSLYRRDPDGTMTTVLAPVSCSNGICWTSDSTTMYYIDTLELRVDAFDYDIASGEVSNRRTCVSGFGEDFGFPDGCTLDAEGMLWVARFAGGGASRFNPVSGEMLAEVRIPPEAGTQVTSVAFGGNGLGDLYLTTAHEFSTAEEAAAKGTPQAGCLFKVAEAELAKIGAVPGQPPNLLRLAAEQG